MYDTKDEAIFHPLKEINTVIKQLLFPVVLKACSTASVCVSAFKIRSTLRTFLVESAFSPITHCALLGFIINLLNAKCSSVTHSAAIFTCWGEKERFLHRLD